MGRQNIDKLNQIMRLTTKKVTATLEGWAEILDRLDNSSTSTATQNLSITVTTAANVEEGSKIADAKDLLS